ncbi:MAG: hypothetical protein ACREP4_05890 [Stenotrophomonas sp.]|uniref:hypothetical protein n=1 Tax=Stenotrophomonas sp. TaxID=69392 RepID=UPI003D6CCD0E
MEDWEYEARQTELQKGLASHFLQDDYNAFITLTFESEGAVSYGHAEKTFGRFMHALRCSLFKERCTYRMPLVPVIESYPGRPLCSGSPHDPIERTHIHCCIKLPGNPLDHKELVRKMWLGAGGVCGDPHVHDRDGDKWFIGIATPVAMRRYVNYSLKQCCFDHQPVLWNFARKIRTA